ncbi:MAG: arsenic transporter, partial [Methylobacteriaceae bacterium]|nr:arsenic transporter [Methylobacteriaceae bacterium]
AIGVTYVLLRLTQARTLAAETIAGVPPRPRLSRGGQAAAAGIGLTALALTAASALGLDLGWPTLLAGLVTAILVGALGRRVPIGAVRQIAWGVLPLVAGLFVLVEALDRTGVVRLLADELRRAALASPRETAAAAALVAGFGSNLVNNLPAGLLAGTAVQAADAPRLVAGGVLIGIDLGPNFSVTGSLATILWLGALRREGLDVSAWRFLKLGALVMPPALLAALGALLLGG